VAQRAWDATDNTEEDAQERRRAEAEFLAGRTSFPSERAPQTLSPGEALLLDLLIERHRDVLRYLADK
jgi:hypothetical protein